MSGLPARAALDYATDDEMLKLYGVLGGGWAAALVGQFVAATADSPVVSLVAVVVALAGVLAVLVGLVAIARKLLADS